MQENKNMQASVHDDRRGDQLTAAGTGKQEEEAGPPTASSTNKPDREPERRTEKARQESRQRREEDGRRKAAGEEREGRPTARREEGRGRRERRKEADREAKEDEKRTGSKGGQHAEAKAGAGKRGRQADPDHDTARAWLCVRRPGKKSMKRKGSRVGSWCDAVVRGKWASVPSTWWPRAANQEGRRAQASTRRT